LALPEPAPLLLFFASPSAHPCLFLAAQLISMNGVAMEGLTQVKVVDMVKRATGTLTLEVKPLKAGRCQCYRTALASVGHCNSLG
jgi:hypothetical protein